MRVPVRMLEHYRFRLRNSNEQQGVGQGQAKPGDRIGRPQQDGDNQRGQGGNEDGGIQYTLEFRIDDIVDWLWEEMQLPESRSEGRPRQGRRLDARRLGSARRALAPRSAPLAEGIDQAARRAERQRRRSPTFTDDDLRYRQLAKREQPAMQAVVILLLDVSGSMGERERQISKTFFFWAIQGLRRQYRHLDLVFVAHTSEAWEFQEDEFFHVTGTGGTVASAGLKKVREIIDERYSPSQYNVYLFYASDGENFPSDQPQAQAALRRSGRRLQLRRLPGSCAARRRRARQRDRPVCSSTWRATTINVGAYRVSGTDDIWNAVRHFFTNAEQGASSNAEPRMTEDWQIAHLAASSSSRARRG